MVTKKSPVEQAKSDVGSLTKEVGDVVVEMNKFSVDTEDGYASAVSIAADVKVRAGEVEEMKSRIVDPLKVALKEIENLFKPALKGLNEVEAKVKKEIGRYRRERLDMADKLLVAASKGDKDALRRSAELRDVPSVPGMSIRDTWDGEVVDEEKIPREYLIPDIKALKAITKAKGKDPGIAGWKATPKSTVAITVGKVEG